MLDTILDSKFMHFFYFAGQFLCQHRIHSSICCVWYSCVCNRYRWWYLFIGKGKVIVLYKTSAGNRRM